MDNIYKEGQIVIAKVNPDVKLVIRRYVDRIYYCKEQLNPNQRELALFEREIVPFNDFIKTGEQILT